MRICAISLLVFAFAISAFVPVRGEDQPKPAPAQEAAESSAGAEESVATKDSASDSVYFVNHVMPLLDGLGCNVTACHGSAKGKSGFKLSMFGADLKHDYEALTKSAAGRRINRAEPLKSLFLLKTTTTIPHKGGKKIQEGSGQYELLASWVAQGALWADENVPELVSIKVLPQRQTLEKDQTRQLSTTAVFSDGSEKDVTQAAFYKSSQHSVVAVDGDGKLQADGYGQAAVVASYMRRFSAARVVVPQPLPSAFPQVEANNNIDELVIAKLKELGIPPSELCTDEQFLRRVHLDVIGTLPTPEVVREFLSDTDAQKRSKLIEGLLECDEFADYWALKWSDLFRIKSEYPSNLWPNAVQAYHRWVRDSIAQNKPYDEFATELITSSGSNFRVPPANYYRAFLKREPQNLAEVTALIFMGARIGCARCHAHPAESWDLDDNVGLAAFFSGVRFKRTQEWKEEVVYFSPGQTMRHPGTGELVKPKLLGGEVLEVARDEDPRVKFAQWLTAPDNPWFARNIVNRTWFWLLGRGIIHEVDDLRPTNLPQNPALLQFLEKELVDNKYDLKHIYRLILNSKTYQLSSKSNEWNRNDVAHFSHYQVKRLGAETLLDAIGQVTEKWDTYQSRIPEPFVRMPSGYRATHLADGSIGLPFLQLFGRPPRDTAFESDRDLRLSMRQTLHLLNSSDVQNKINASPRLRRLITELKDDAKIVEEIYLSTLSRVPAEEEGKKILAYFSGKGPPEQVLAEKKSAEEALAKVKGELLKADAGYQAAEKAAKQAETAAAQAKAAAAKGVVAKAAAVKAAADKRRQADEAKKKLDDLVQNGHTPAESRLAAAAELATAAATAKAAMDQPLAEAKDATADARQAHQAAEKAALEAETKAKAVSEDAGKSEQEKKQAADEAAAKRKAADEAGAALTKAEQNEQQAQGQAEAAAQKLAAAEAEKKSAEQALANVKKQVAAASEASRAAEKAAKDAETAAANAKPEDTAAAQIAAEKTAAQKRKLANEAKAKRDKLAADDKAAKTKLAAANKKIAAASAPRTAAQRQQALQDLLWALLNTKEFLFNH